MINITKRIFYLDEIRALAILLIILVSTSKGFISNQSYQSALWILPSLFENIGNLGFQLFFMVSGALLLNKKCSIPDFLKNRFSKILIPLLFWIVVMIIFKILFMGHASNPKGIVNIILNEGDLWFMWTLIGLYLFLPVINSYINHYNTKGCEYFLAVWLFTLILVTFKMYPIKNVELRYFAGFMGYMVLGWYLSNKKFKSISDRSMMICGIIMFLISSAVALHFVFNSIKIGSPYKLSILPMLQATGIYLAIKYAADYSEKNQDSRSMRIYSFFKDTSLGKGIFSLSVCSYGIFLVHKFPIWIFEIIDKTLHIYSRNPFKWEPLMFIIVLLFSWGLILVLSKIPYLNKISATDF